MKYDIKTEKWYQNKRVEVHIRCEGTGCATNITVRNKHNGNIIYNKKLPSTGRREFDRNFDKFIEWTLDRLLLNE